jgi:hypothetical protein
MRKPSAGRCAAPSNDVGRARLNGNRMRIGIDRELRHDCLLFKRTEQTLTNDTVASRQGAHMRQSPPGSSLPLWLQPGVPDTPELEPADLGTAFGLDLSLLPPDDTESQASPDTAPNGWLQRLGLPAR